MASGQFTVYSSIISFQENKLNSTDNTGKEILRVISGANRFNRWMYQTIKPYIKGNTLEIGSGIGNLSSFFLNDNISITLSDTEQEYINILNKKIGSHKNLQSILSINLEQSSFENTYMDMKEKFDTVFLLNVLEHIKDDELALRNIHFLLKPGGTILILSPAYSFLFSSLDRALGHHRRYTTESLKTLLTKSGIIPLKSFYFNFIGIIAWLYAKILRLKTIPAGEMSLFNRLVPIGRLIDKILFRKAGLSAIIVGKKRS